MSAGVGVAAPRPGRALRWVLLAFGSEDFAAAYDASIFRVYGFFAYRLNSREEAEDLCQVTYEHGLRAWGRFDRTRSAPVTWLLAIARNVLIDHYRRQPAVRDRPLHEVDESRLPAAAASGPSLGLEPDLERALVMLAPRSRELIALRYGAELTGAEIAELSGLIAGKRPADPVPGRAPDARDARPGGVRRGGRRRRGARRRRPPPRRARSHSRAGRGICGGPAISSRRSRPRHPGPGIGRSRSSRSSSSAAVVTC